MIVAAVFARRHAEIGAVGRVEGPDGRGAQKVYFLHSPKRPLRAVPSRLTILTGPEIEELYGLPHFTAQERHLYFDVSPAERAAVEAVRTTAAAVHLARC